MDCSLIQGDLIAYHFAAASEEERQRVESHLVGCQACLRSYLALKAHVDRTGKPPEQPSAASRLKLRAAVERRFRPSPVRRVIRLLASPVPLYQSVALAAVVVLGVAFGPALAHQLPPLSRTHTHDTSSRVDTSRTTAESTTLP
jgi:anti-sigma factor RsiW